jgi:methionyl aminopeptidase
MVDTWATVGSCAQIGKNVHLSGGVGIGGVLEPLQANPTIIEDNCFIGARSEVVEGVIVEENSVLGMGVFLGQSTKIYDRATGGISYGRVPTGSVVVAGRLPYRAHRGDREAGRCEDAVQDQHQRAPARVTKAAMSVNLKSPEDIEGMRVAGRLASELLDYLTPHVKPGITTGEINDLAHDYMVNVQHTIPATLNYAPPGHSPYPASLCTSVNHVVCHGIPGDKKLKEGDTVNIDVTVIKDGYHGDTSRMFHVGKPSIQAKRLSEITYEAMWRGIRAVKPGAHLGDVGATIQRYAEGHGFSVVREFCGHGIGRQFHEEPQVLHYGRPGTGLKLQPGMIFTVEPMINAGRPGIRCLADGWTIVTADHSLSAQWEHTVLVTPEGFDVLTVSEGSPPPPAIAS